jgi:hypothetical protein
MANMGYCRFENTYRDMMDCYYNINNNLSEREHKYREKILELCEQMISEFDENNLVDEEEE